MRDLQKVYENCLTMMDEIGIDYGNIVEVSVNKRAKNRWGQCRHKRVGSLNGKPKLIHMINISEILLDERVPIDGLQNTIIHEILHSCPGCYDHGSEWKKRAAKVKRELGYNIKTCGSAIDKGVSNEVISDYIKPKYIVVCEKCGREVKRTRMCSIIKEPELWSCGKCGGNFKRKQ